MIRSTAFILAFLAVSVASFNCNGTTTIEAPSAPSNTTFYPRGWTGKGLTPRALPNQVCFFTVNVPKGYFATVTFNKRFNSTLGAYMVYSNHKMMMLNDNDRNPFIFTHPKFQINLAIGNSTTTPDTTFGFKVVWSKFPELQKNFVNITRGNAPIAVRPTSNLTTFVGENNSHISLMAFSMANSTLNHLLRQTLIFSGESVLDEFIGTLGQVLESKQQLTAYGNKISVHTFGLNSSIDYPLFMGQHFEDTNGTMMYQGANCPSSGNCTVTLNSHSGRSWTVTSFHGPEYIKSFKSFPDTAVINVYENRISNTTCVAKLTSSNYKKQLPLKVNGNMKFYELKGNGVYEMVLTRDATRASRLHI
ncbi:CUB-like domain-containing protein [Caenorhabditis elegans]|nr:CUB-like domain-containing protein [Caenorhabditis elegans]NP_502472.1 CUB-like domain-containing protein [Caenorhabditis elegans]CAB05136.1 CUB-like domain-containing protein [Caenorhabditis elegans]CAI9652608.1 CUB-like domain-containing protein [Caenorhabditis elegans]|eukprot:NP_502472.1 Downstream Of DAF-16 (regulated by DAF-16) [Caenorhabditis elegans]